MVDWSPFFGTNWYDDVDTGVGIETLRDLADRCLDVPDSIEVHPRTAKILADRQKMAEGAAPLVSAAVRSWRLCLRAPA